MGPPYMWRLMYPRDRNVASIRTRNHPAAATSTVAVASPTSRSVPATSSHDRGTNVGGFDFIPPQAEQPPVRAPRMPRIDELPMPAQNQIRARQAEAAAAPEKPRQSLLQRLANVGLGRRDEETEPPIAVGRVGRQAGAVHRGVEAGEVVCLDDGRGLGQQLGAGALRLDPSAADDHHPVGDRLDLGQ